MKHWREVVIAGLLVVCSFLVGRRVERRAYEAVIAENVQMKTFLSNTVAQVSKSDNEQIKTVFRQLGFNIPQVKK